MKMADPTRDESTLRSISKASLAAYLELHDWSHVDDWPGTASVFARTFETREQRIWVPHRETFVDYADNMERSIGLLAEVENRSPLDVLIDLKATSSDVVRIDVLNSGLRRELSLQAAGELMDHAYTMISAAARAVRKPRPAYLGSMTNEVAGFVASVTPAPTDFNTFGIRLLLPEWTEQGQSTMWAVDPFSRRAANSLVHGLSAIDAALSVTSQAESHERLEDSVSLGVSANLCSALAGLAVQARGFGDAFQVGVSWSRLRPPKDPTPFSVPFSIHTSEALGEASRHLRSRASFPDESIRADVVLLAREPEEEDGRVLLLVDSDDRIRRIDAVFDSNDYQVAIEAHKRKVPIVVDGDLLPAGRSYELRRPRNVRLDVDE